MLTKAVDANATKGINSGTDGKLGTYFLTDKMQDKWFERHWFVGGNKGSAYVDGFYPEGKIVRTEGLLQNVAGTRTMTAAGPTRSFGPVSGVCDPITLEEFLSGIPQVPVILLENDSELKHRASITMNDYVGMKQCVDHLIDVHGCRKLAYISGPLHQKDSVARFLAFKDSMKGHGLDIREDQIVYGDFSGQDVVLKILDALVLC